MHLGLLASTKVCEYCCSQMILCVYNGGTRVEDAGNVLERLRGIDHRSSGHLDKVSA